MKIVVTRASGGYRIELTEGGPDPHSLVVSEENEARALAFTWRARLEESEGVPVELLWSAHTTGDKSAAAGRHARTVSRPRQPRTQD